MDQAQKLLRRSFLKALALGMSAPLSAAFARQVLAAPGPRPARLMVVYFPDGVPPEHYTPTGAADSFDVQVGEAVLGPLEPYKKQLNVLLGLQIGGGEENHDAISQLLLPGREQGRSFEQVIAKKLGSEALLLGALPLKSVGEQFNSGAKNALFRDGDWMRTQVNPVRAADALFGASMASAGAPATATATATVDADAALRARVLALTEAELDVLHGQVRRLSQEQSKLSIHLAAVRELKARQLQQPLMAASAASGCGVALPALDALRKLTNNGASTDYFYSEQNLPSIYPAQLELAAQALVCGRARVVGLQVSYGVSEAVWSFLPGFLPSDQFHGTLSHGDGSKPEIRARFAKAKRWLMQGLADKVVSALDQPDPLDPAHSVLDNTLIYVCSELADGAMHNTNTKTMYIDNGRTQIDTQLPLITIGGAAGALQTGKLWSFANRRHTDLLFTFCESLAAAGADFGQFQAIRELRP